MIFFIVDKTLLNMFVYILPLRPFKNFWWNYNNNIIIIGMDIKAIEIGKFSIFSCDHLILIWVGSWDSLFSDVPDFHFLLLILAIRNSNVLSRLFAFWKMIILEHVGIISKPNSVYAIKIVNYICGHIME